MLYKCKRQWQHKELLEKTLFTKEQQLFPAQKMKKSSL
jgi:hypothetical protein